MSLPMIQAFHAVVSSAGLVFGAGIMSESSSAQCTCLQVIRRPRKGRPRWQSNDKSTLSERLDTKN